MATRNGLAHRLTISASTIGTAGINPPAASHDAVNERSSAAGTSSGQIDKVFSDTALAITSTPTDLDLAGGVADPVTGSTQTFSVLTYAYIKNTGATAVQVGGDANSVPIFGAAADYVIIPPGGTLFLDGGVTGWTVTAGTGDILQIATASGSSTVDIILAGR